MQSVIDLMARALPCELVANQGANLSECAVYDFYSTGWDGVKRSIMLKVSIFAQSMQRAMQIQDALERALVTPGDKSLTETTLSCRQNGGGWLNDGNRHCRISYFELIIKDTNL
jgi:hypothetical protein